MTDRDARSFAIGFTMRDFRMNMRRQFHCKLIT